MDEAAHRAFDGIKGARAIENAGFIVQNADGKFAYSSPVTQNNHDSFSLRAQIQQGHRLVGLYHTHPGTDSDASLFSPDDVNVANQLKVPSYIMTPEDGIVRRYTPGKSATFDTHARGVSSKASQGEVIDDPEPLASFAQPDNATAPSS
jgi:hypothetical protein